MAANTHSLDLEASSSQYADAADSASLSVTGNLTIEAWVKFESLPGSGAYAPIVTKATQSSGDGSYAFSLFNSAGTYKLNLFYSTNGTYAGGNDKTSADFAPSTGVWYHVAVALTAATPKVQFFKNGVQLGTDISTVGTSIENGTRLVNVGSFDDHTSFLDGLIDEVRIWAAVRTEAELAANKDVQLLGNESGLNAYWQLNNAYTDSTANSNTLTPHGSPVFSTDVPFVGASSKSLFFAQL